MALPAGSQLCVSRGGVPGTRPSKSQTQVIEAKGLGGNVVAHRRPDFANGNSEAARSGCGNSVLRPTVLPAPGDAGGQRDPQIAAHRPLPRCPGVTVDSPGAQAPLGPALSPKPWPQAQPPERRPQTAK